MIREVPQWTLLTVDVPSGRVLRTNVIDERLQAIIRGASLHPDGKRLAYQRAEQKYDIWLMEGLPEPASGWLKLFRHWSEP